MNENIIKEISEELNISRNAVFDSLKRSLNILEDYETKLELLKKDEIKNELIEKFEDLTKEEIKQYIEKL